MTHDVAVFQEFTVRCVSACLLKMCSHLADLLRVSGCRCVRGSVQSHRGAPPVSSRAAPSLPLKVAWRTEKWEEVGERRPRTQKPATATLPSVLSPPPQPLRPLPRPRPPRLPMPATGWGFRQICPAVQTRPPAACTIMMTARREALKRIT